MENHNYLNGLLRFSPLIMWVNVVLICHFFISWYFSYRKTGWVVDPWNLGLLTTYFLPFLLLYPFSGAAPNIISVGGHLLSIQQHLNQAYIISLIGYFSFFTGSRIFRHLKFKTPIYWLLVLPLKKTVGRLYQKVVLNTDLVKLLFIIYCFSLAVMLFFAFKAGSLSNPRAYFYKNPSISAFYNLVLSLSGIVSSIIIARIFSFNLFADKLLLGLFMFVNLFIGSRSFALGPLVGVFTLVVFLIWNGRFKAKQMLIYGSVIMILVVALTKLRASGSSAAKSDVKFGFLAEIFYGNSFSDLRDFAWCLSAFDGNYYYGKTYASAFISFIPSNYSDFRQKYTVGRITARMGGFDPHDHPGLRPGMFGESYFNFGILGVIVIGMTLGYGARYMDYKAKLAARTNDKLDFFVSGVATIFIGNLSITSGFFAVYTFIFVVILLYLLRLCIKSFKQFDVKSSFIDI